MLFVRYTVYPMAVVVAGAVGLAGGCSRMPIPEQAIVNSQTGAEFIRTFSLSNSYPEVDSETKLSSLIGFEDIGISKAEFVALTKHSTQEYLLQESLDATADEDKVPFRSGTSSENVIKGRECYNSYNNWRVTGVRFAPYELLVPGHPGAYKSWSLKHKLPLDQGMQVRLVMNPYCLDTDLDTPEFKALDQSFHFIYELRPTDTAIADKIFANAQSFVSKQLSNDPTATSQQNLNLHAEGLNSSEYKSFRKATLLDWAALGSASQKPKAAELASIVGAYKYFRDNFLQVIDFESGDGASVPSSDNAALAGDTPYRQTLKTLVTRYATRSNFRNLTFMTTTGGINWSFGNLTLGKHSGYDKLVSKGAKDVYSLVKPLPMRTFSAAVAQNGLDIELKVMTDSMYYADARSFPMGSNSELLKNTISTNRKAFKEVELVDPGTGFSNAESQDLKTSLLKFADPEVVNATTTACASCHLLSQATVNPTTREIEIFEDAYRTHMGGNFLTIRTVNEVDQEFRRANEELHQLPVLASCPTAAVEICLDNGGGKACFDSKRCK